MLSQLPGVIGPEFFNTTMFIAVFAYFLAHKPFFLMPPRQAIMAADAGDRSRYASTARVQLVYAL